MAKGEILHWARESEAEVGAGFKMWRLDGLRTYNGKVRAAVVSKHRVGRNFSHNHLGTGLMEVHHAELWAIGLELREAVTKTYILQTHGVSKVTIFTNLQAAIRQMLHLEPGPVQQLARCVSHNPRALHNPRIRSAMHCISGHICISTNEDADQQENLVPAWYRAGKIREQVFTLVVN